jgi:hypothetical protein
VGSVGISYVVINNALDAFDLYGGGPFIGPAPPGTFPSSYKGPGTTEPVVTPTGYNLMTNLAESVINTMNLKLVEGWLSNVEQASELAQNDEPLTNVNTVGPPSPVKFIPIGYYSDGSQHAMLNTTFQGSSGTWTSSNPLVMYINQDGVAWALSAGTTTIKYTPPNGAPFASWVMYVE